MRRRCCLVLLIIYFVLLPNCLSRLKIDDDLRSFLGTLEPYEQTPNDIVFVLDESGSIGADNFPQVLLFTELIARQLSVSPAHSRISVMTFATDPRTHIDYIKNTYGNNMCTLLRDIKKIDYIGEWTHTSVAMETARKLLTQARRNANRIIILVTDGRSNDGYDPTEISRSLKNDGVIIFAVGVADINEAELEAVATSSDYIYILSDFKYIYDVNEQLKEETKEVSWDNVTDKSLCNTFCSAGYDCCDSFADCYCGTKGGNYQCACKPGFSGSGHQGKCFKCPRGTYKSEAGIHPCHECPKYSSTPHEGSTALNDCTCISGYEGNPSSGIPCKAVECAELKAPKGGIIIPQDCGHTYDAECSFRCNEGYCPYFCNKTNLIKDENYPWYFQPSEPRKCLATGIWSGPDFYCDAIQCPALNYPENGKHNCSNPNLHFLFNSVCHITCNKGYNFHGSEYRTCLLNGTWSGKDATCKAVTCEPLKTNALLSLKPSKCGSDQMPYSSVCQYYCKKGFQLFNMHTNESSNGERKCLADGKWLNINEKITCKDVSPPSISCFDKNIAVNTDHHKPTALINWTVPDATDNVMIKSVQVIEPKGIYKPPFAFPIGQTKVVYEAVDSSDLKNTCAFTVTVTDTEAPQIISCPKNIEVEHSDRTGKPVYWKEPQFSDNSGRTSRITKSHVNGQTFVWGTHNVVYTVLDAAGNNASCTFKIKVKAYPCPYADPPDNGTLACDTWLNGQFCSVQCSEGYKFLTEPEDVYFCKQSTLKWDRLPGSKRYGVVKFPWPNCGKIEPAKGINVSLSLEFHPPSCDEKSIMKVKQKFIETLKQQEKKIPNLCSNSVGCDPKNVNVTCKKSSSLDSLKRQKRSENAFSSLTDITEESEVFHAILSNSFTFKNIKRSRRDAEKYVLIVSFDVEISPESLALQTFNKTDCKNCSEEIDAENEQLVTYGTTFANDMKSNVSDIVKDVYQEPSLTAENFIYNVIPLCKKGEILKDKSCVKCPMGTYYKESLKSCIDCASGYYQDVAGSTQCKRCPSGKQTLSSQSKSVFDCKAFCHPGTYSTTGMEPCIACPLDYYQHDSSAKTCIKCPQKLKTSFTGATSLKDCVSFCSPGSYSSTGFEPCMPCPVGTYQSFHKATSCNNCPQGITTVFSGANRESLCRSIDYCAEFHPCANGSTCISVNNSYVCNCPDGLLGKDCEINLNDCDDNSCENNGTCIDGLNTFSCICKTGFTGDRCEHNIDDCAHKPCKNSGTCSDKLNDYDCICQPGFIGKNCEVNVDDCNSEPCLNGGTCFDMQNDFRCCCPTGFTGHTCEIKEDFNVCDEVTCHNGGSCNSSNDEEFNCICPTGFIGELCEININDCSSDPCLNGGNCIDSIGNFICKCSLLYDGKYCEKVLPSEFSVEFPLQVTSNYIELQNSKPLFAITVSFFMRTNFVSDSNKGTPISYSYYNPDSEVVVDNALTLFDINKMILYLHGESFHTGYTANSGYDWHHYAITWDNIAGAWVFYVDGKTIASGSNVAVNNYFWPGIFIVGQEQDSIGGSFSISEAFVGEISEFNVWDYAMTLIEIEEIRSACGYIGNIIAWPTAQKYVQGDLVINYATNLCTTKNICSADDCHCIHHNSTEGKECRGNFDNCTKSPCLNDQKCTQLNKNKAVCDCTEGYGGKFCEHDINECFINNGNCSHTCINIFGSYYCSCPEGLILTKDNHTCQDTRYCKTVKQTYLEDEVWSFSCQECTCKSGEILCQEKPCPNITCEENEISILLPGQCCEKCIKQPKMCSLYSNGTVETFDSVQFQFQGDCRYTLVEDRIHGAFVVQFESSDYNANSVILYINCQKVTISNEGIVLLNDKEMLFPFKDENLFIYNTTSSIKIWTDSGFSLEWLESGIVHIGAPYSYQEQLSGLCGNFNGETFDDLMTKQYLPAKTVSQMIHSWRVDAYKYCDYKKLQYKIDNIIETSISVKIKMAKISTPWIGNCLSAKKHVRNKAKKLCRALRRKALNKCRKYVNPEPFYLMCLQDVCSCGSNMPCFCDSVFAYIYECFKNNIYIFDWEDAKVCTKRCPVGMVYDDCGPPCQATCSSNQTSLTHCFNTKCKPGCYCPAHLIFHNNECIEKEKCPVIE